MFRFPSIISFAGIKFPLLLLSLSLSISTNLAWDDSESVPQYQVPRSEVEFICGHDIRTNFSVEETYTKFYKDYLPQMSSSKFRSVVEMSGMENISSSKYYYKLCNLTSPEVLISFAIDGWLQFGNSSTQPDPEYERMITRASNPEVMKRYFTQHVCLGDEKDTGVEWFQIEIERWYPDSPLPAIDHVDHKLRLLCEDRSYYEDVDEPEPGFMIFGFFVGMAMVGMIFTELQKLDNRPRAARRAQYRLAPRSPSPMTTTTSTGTSGGGGGSGTAAPQEIEMV